MKKSNPLFVDTTKFNGDALFTQVELNEIPRYVAETVAISVTDKAGTQQTVELERVSDSRCAGQVFLTYRQEVTYSFSVSRNGQTIFETEPKTIEASYLIQDIWKPISLMTEAEAEPEMQVEPLIEPPPQVEPPPPSQSLLETQSQAQGQSPESSDLKVGTSPESAAPALGITVAPQTEAEAALTAELFLEIREAIDEFDRETDLEEKALAEADAGEMIASPSEPETAGESQEALLPSEHPTLEEFDAESVENSNILIQAQDASELDAHDEIF